MTIVKVLSVPNAEPPYTEPFMLALLPVVTYAGPLFAGMVTGSMVIETLFSVPGIGSEFTNSITNRDSTLVMGLTILFGVLVIVMNLVSDIVAAIVDPRIKLDK